MRCYTPCSRIIKTPSKGNNNPQQFFKSALQKTTQVMQNNCRAMYVNLASQLITSVRKKNNQIENLIKQQSENTYKPSINESEAFQSLKKLKKVLRLMQIVCKIIRQKNTLNNSCSTQKFISYLNEELCFINQIRKNGEHQNNMKLSRRQSQQHIQELQTNISQFAQKVNQRYKINKYEINIENISKKQKPKLQLDEFTQNQDQSQQDEITHNKNEQNITKYCITRQNSTTEILNNCLAKSIITNTKLICQNKQISTNKRAEKQPQERLIYKRYKSIAKICINSLNILAHVYRKLKICHKNSTVQEIIQQIQQVSNKFNQLYHCRKNSCQYNHDFFNLMRANIQNIYKNLHQIYNENFCKQRCLRQR